jgi:hypothetical protein
MLENYIPEGNPNAPNSISLLDIVQNYNTDTGRQFPTRWQNVVDLIRPEVLPEWGEITGTLSHQTDLIDYIAAGYQPLNSNLTSWAGVARATGFDAFVATPSSANLRSLVTDETGTGSLVFSNSPTLTTASLGSSTATTQTPSDNSTKVATTAYVDAAILGQNYKEAVKYATIAALPAIVYSNGTAGVGATLTGVAVGALGIDSASPAVNDRVLVKNQVSTFQNGWYKVTATGSGIAVFVLTRTTDAHQSFEFFTGDTSFVTSGATLSTTTWAYTGIDSPVIGTDAITFAQTAGQGSFTAGNGIAITGVSIAIDTSVTVDKTTAQTLTNKTLTTPILSNATSTSAGQLGYDGNVLYGNPSASNAGVIEATHFIRQDAPRTLANSGAAQALFNGGVNGNGSFDATVGLYKIHAMVEITLMSNVSGNGAFSLEGTGTLGAIMMHAVGYDTAPLTGAGTQTGCFTTTKTFANPMTAASVATQTAFEITGQFEVTGAGTVIPSYLLNTAINTANVVAGSFCTIKKLGTDSVVYIGKWD